MPANLVAAATIVCAQHTILSDQNRYVLYQFVPSITLYTLKSKVLCASEAIVSGLKGALEGRIVE